jgi:signal transduction histidine kinase
MNAVAPVRAAEDTQPPLPAVSPSPVGGNDVLHGAGESGPKAARRINVVGEMASGIAHDFRNVLAVLQSALHLTERHLGEPERARAFLAAARQSIERGANLTARLLALARPHQFEPRLFNVSDLIREFSPFLRYTLRPGIRLRLRLGNDLPACYIDPDQLEAALLNLVVNARDAMPQGGEILIESGFASSASASPGPDGQDWVLVSVHDDGAGMSEETLAHIFEPWFTTKGKDGTGLGLPQVASFLKKVDGRLSVRSRLTQGTTFHLYFPVPTSSRGSAHA